MTDARGCERETQAYDVEGIEISKRHGATHQHSEERHKSPTAYLLTRTKTLDKANGHIRKHDNRSLRHLVLADKHRVAHRQKIEICKRKSDKHQHVSLTEYAPQQFVHKHKRQYEKQHIQHSSTHDIAIEVVGVVARQRHT